MQSTELLSILKLIIIFIVVFVAIIFSIIKKRKNAYFQITKDSYNSIKYDKGKYGEYMLYRYLQKFEKDGAKFLFNVYIPKENGKTTEIDVLMICHKGIFVFESKNYNGWIFGDELQKKWCQVLPKDYYKSHKEYFYNPIMQNDNHIKYLKNIIGDQVYIRSLIVFSGKCTLKNIKLTRSDISVIKLQNVALVISELFNKINSDNLAKEEIDNLYIKLYPYSQANSIEKTQHIINIYNNSRNKHVQKVDSLNVLKTELNNSRATDSDSIITDYYETSINSNTLCPECGKRLILRTAKRGRNAGKQFYGCSGYPECRHIQNIK